MKSVLNGPGCTMVTPIPSGLSSAARDSETPSNAHLVAP